jgi:chorismate mutase
MSANLDGARSDGNTGTAASRARRWGSTGRADPVCAYVAPELGLKPAAVAHVLRTINHKCAAIIRAFRALGDDDRLARFWEPLVRAFEGREPPPLCEATLLLAQEADAAEDIDELRFLSNRSDANLVRLIRAKRASISREIAVLDALLEEQRQRRCA